MSAERVREDADRWLRQARDDPDALAGLTPGEAFNRAEAQAAAVHAHAVIDRVSALVEP